MDLAQYIAELPLERRLALSYAPATSRLAFLALFALDARLATIVRQAREPLLGQMRLAWWRERLLAATGGNPAGEPLLALLEHPAAGRIDLVPLVDGWEALLGQAPLMAAAFEQFAAARTAACVSLANRLSATTSPAEVAIAGRGWALADLAANLSNAEELETVRQVIEMQDWRAAQLSRALRPLTVLHGLARRSKGTRTLLSGPTAGLVAVRLGLLGF